MLLIEGAAWEIAGIIARRTAIPVISCGSDTDYNSQILIIGDIIGLSQGPVPKFVMSYVKIDTDVV